MFMVGLLFQYLPCHYAMYTVDCDYVEDDDRRLDDVGTSELLVCVCVCVWVFLPSLYFTTI